MHSDLQGSKGTAGPGASGYRRWAERAIVGLALVYLVIGFVLYIGGDPDDLKRRWIENGYLMLGQDPIQVAIRGEPVIEPYGRAEMGLGYPPWSYILSMPLIPPFLSLNSAKLIFFLWNILALFLVLYVIRHAALEVGFEESWVYLAGASLACLAVPVALRHGQYGLVTTACLWSFLHLESKGRPVLAGTFLAVACIKPQIGALFFLVPLMRASFRTCLSAAALLVTASMIAAHLCHSSMMAMARGMFSVGLNNDISYFYLGILHPLKEWLGRRGVLVVSITIFFLLALFCLRRMGRVSPLEMGVVPALISTLWMSHRTHDLAVLSIPVFVLLTGGLRLGIDRGLIAVFCLSHWLPHLNRFYEGWYMIPTAYRLLWLTVLMVFVMAYPATRMPISRP